MYLASAKFLAREPKSIEEQINSKVRSKLQAPTHPLSSAYVTDSLRPNVDLNSGQVPLRHRYVLNGICACQRLLAQSTTEW